MKCTFCTYSHKPDNPLLMKAHAELEMLENNTGGVFPVVVWRDGEFTLVKEAEEGEQTFFLNIFDRRPGVVKETVEPVIAEEVAEEELVTEE